MAIVKVAVSFPVLVIEKTGGEPCPCSVYIILFGFSRRQDRLKAAHSTNNTMLIFKGECTSAAVKLLKDMQRTVLNVTVSLADIH